MRTRIQNFGAIALILGLLLSFSTPFIGMLQHPHIVLTLLGTSWFLIAAGITSLIGGGQRRN
jgi:vacuolar-type H+-ATPase subunit I/STV1